MTPADGRPARSQQRRHTEQRILVAARELFAAVGYERATIRAVAAAVQVDPALVMQYFGSKENLFRQAVHMPPDELPEMGPDRLAELLLDVIGLKLGAPQAGAMALLRSMLTHPEATERMRADTGRQVRQFADAIPAEDAELRAALLVATSLGLTIGRQLLELDALRAASPDQITTLLRPCFHSLAAGEARPDGGPR